MDQLARLGVVFDSEGAQQLIKSLKDVQTNSKGAEAATEQLADATKKGGAAAKTYSTGVDQMSAHLLTYKKHLEGVKIANDNAVKSQRALGAAGLNLGRQFSDVGVSLAGGINPLMVLIQQGPQIADGFAVASAAGLSFKAVLTGLWTSVAPLLTAFAPWIAGLAAVSAGVYLLVRAHDEHIKRIETVNKEIGDLHKKLSDATPWLFEVANQSNLAADGTKNFNAWVEKANSKLPEYTANLRAAAIEQARLNSWNAKAQQQTLASENFRVVGGAPVYKGKGSAWWEFGLLTGALDKGYKEYTAKAREAAENVKAANAQLEAMLAAPTAAFGAPSGGGGSGRGGGGRASANDNSRGLRGVANLSVDPSTVVDLSILKPVRGQDEQVKTAEDASKRLAQIQKDQADARVATEKLMWDGLIGLSNSGNKKLAAIGKAAAIAQATIDGFLAVQKALSAFPPPFNIAAAALVGGLAAANVASIAGVKGFAAGGYTGDGGIGQIAGVTHGKEFVVNAAATRRNRDTLEAMNAGRAIPKNPSTANGNTRGSTTVIHAPTYSMGSGNFVTEKVFADFDRKRQQDRDEFERSVPAIVAKHQAQKG
jgi:hypothetical protein